jgi:pyruvate dehydrogenase E1 component alpha subunit
MPHKARDKPVCTFEIRCHACLGPDGKPVGEMPSFADDRKTMVALYRGLVLTRTFDEKAIALQRTGRLGTYASSLGQEAVSIGAAAAMQADDVLLPSFREHGAQLWRGVSLVELLQYWGGDERGSAFQAQAEDFPVSIPVASHIPHACGVALAMKLRGEPRAALAIFGDGATSKGDFYEAINVAGVWGLPAVFVISNNQWAISVPRARQTATETLAQKAIAAGIEGLQVDGNDVIAVREVCAEALERARTEGRPTLIEALTYRMGDHTTADDARRYRSDENVSPHWKEDPIARLRLFLTETSNWSHEDEEGLIEACRAEVEEAASAYLALPPEPPQAMFDTLYETLPQTLAAQRALALSEADSDA